MQEELYHHGILGQKWGIRRYQNADGSLTDAGRKRYAKRLSRAVKEKNQRSADLNTTAYIFGSKRAANLLERENKNYISVMNRVSKEVKPAQKQEDELKAAYEKLRAVDRTGPSDDALKAWDNYIDARGAYNSAMTDFLDKYAGDILGARLKDLGYEDTKEGRKILSQVLHKGVVSDWYLVPGVHEDQYNYANSKWKYYEDNFR